MKIGLFMALSMLLPLLGQAQDTIPLYSDVLARQTTLRRPSVGLDLYQVVWFLHSASLHGSPTTYAYPVSATLYLPDRRPAHADRALYINVGYVAYGGLLQRNIYQAGGSTHIRVGVEHTRKHLILGYGGLLSGWSGQGSFIFRGPTFGDYQETIGRRNGLAVGGEGHFGIAIPFGNRLSLRTLLRGSLLMKLGRTDNLDVPHLSGIDFQAESQLGMGISWQANLVFRL